MTDHANPLDAPWETVDLRLVYQDGHEVKSRDVHLSRMKVEDAEREKFVKDAHDRFAGLADESDKLQSALDLIREWTLTPEEFEQRVMTNIENMVVAPLRVRGGTLDSFRVLAPWAVREVQITVNAASEASPLILPMN